MRIPLEEIPEYRNIKTELNEGLCVCVNGLVPSAMECVLKGLKEGFDFCVVVTMDETRASGILNNYMAFDKEVYVYPAKDPMFFKADIRGSYLSEQRSTVVKRILENAGTVIITTPDGFFDELTPASDIKKSEIVLKKGGSINVIGLGEKLVDLGYENETQVTAHGEFSIRGNIVDIFPYASNVPYRLDLFGDDIESIKTFDTESQRSVSGVSEIRIFPGGDTEEKNFAEAEEGKLPKYGFLNYFDNKKTLFVIDEPAKILKESLGFNPVLKDSEADDSEPAENITPESTKRTELLFEEISKRPSVVFSELGNNAGCVRINKTHSINSKSIASYNGRFLELVEDLKKYRKEGFRVDLIAAGDVRAANLIKNLAENEITVGKKEADPKNKIKASDIQVSAGTIKIGFEFPSVKYSLISEVDIFGNRLTRKRKKRYKGDPIRDFTDLNVGDYVVHEQHGVGVYEGIERIKVEGIEKDYMKIGYAKNASLYVLATQFDRIQKYGGADGIKPKLNRLGGSEWTATKEKVRAAVKDIAADLVKLYAARQTENGFCFTEDTVWQSEFEAAFEYEETEDQLHAIEAVKADMESSRIMDRLICGDVGFGKTEVAIRAAFKAVQDGKQVAFLTPTTILAQQHFNTIESRVKNYPVTVRALSRFQTNGEQNKVIEELKKGSADIVVGTHRLLSKDVKFKDLGLLIIDEEQRFGVTHKEKIKQLRKSVDVITMSATPIPRTLQMSLTGIRDMSLLTEPPVDRVPIQTYVMEYSDDAVKEAIVRETNRGGQVYYVYNRTNNIDMVADKIQRMLPHLNVAFAHGKMANRELEQIMFDFTNGDIDVLVSTTIVETGLDIPNVNTIIIHDADNFGLSQLYQLRGRVGRSSRMAYAFLMYKKDKLIKEVAEKRLKAIREFSDLGSGIKIAMRDLEIRGAGNILGAEQSGHMEAVGYELYCKMLNEAVALLKGESVSEEFETTVDINIDGYIPASYITNEFEKLNMYKRISAIENMEDLEDIKNELTDRFGEIPKVTENLLYVALIKAKAHNYYITEITIVQANFKDKMQGKYEALNAGVKKTAERKAFKISMFARAPIDPFKIHGFLKEHEEELRFVADKEPYFVFSPLKVPQNLLEIKDTLIGFFGTLGAIIDKGSKEDN